MAQAEQRQHPGPGWEPIPPNQVVKRFGQLIEEPGQRAIAVQIRGDLWCGNKCEDCGSHSSKRLEQGFGCRLCHHMLLCYKRSTGWSASFAGGLQGSV